MSSPDGKRPTLFRRDRISTKLSLLSAAAFSALIGASTRAATIVVTDQTQFDDAIAMATQPGQTDTIDATAAGTIDAGRL